MFRTNLEDFCIARNIEVHGPLIEGVANPAEKSPELVDSLRG